MDELVKYLRGVDAQDLTAVIDALGTAADEIERLHKIERRYLWLRPGLAQCCEPTISIEEFERKIDDGIQRGDSPRVLRGTSEMPTQWTVSPQSLRCPLCGELYVSIPRMGIGHVCSGTTLSPDSASSEQS